MTRFAQRAIAVLFGCALALVAAAVDSGLQPIPPLQSRVTDLTATLDAGQRQALEAQLAALEAAYSASRRSRDVLVARFQALRGSLIDVTQAENAFFESATSYIQALTELDAARYVLLSRTGRLLDTLGIAPDRLGTAG